MGLKMKLIYAIVHDEDARKLTDELNKEGFSVTKLSSSGGFLKSGNTTLLTGVEDDQVEKVISIIEDKSKSRTETIDPSMTTNATGGMFMQYPVEVTVGGATVFVVNVEQFKKI